MKIGLKQLPSTHDLELAYQQFAQRPEQGLPKPQGTVIALKDFALYCQWVRFDSRLGEMSVQYLLRNWRRINPTELRDEFLSQPWPAVLGVLAEFAQRQLEPGLELTLFQNWKIVATTEFSPACWEQFFIGKRRMGGKAMFDDARFSLEEYRKWGYLSREVLINKPEATAASYSSPTRRQILSDLVETHSRITTKLYWNELGQSISKRQAERDLLAFPRLRPMGRTQGRYFVRRIKL